MKNNPNKLWIIVFALGWLFDFLFWENAIGVNFAIFAMACLIAAFYLLLGDGLRPNRTSLKQLFRRRLWHCKICKSRHLYHAKDSVPCRCHP